jgi:hypothetical protein
MDGFYSTFEHESPAGLKTQRFYAFLGDKLATNKPPENACCQATIGISEWFKLHHTRCAFARVADHLILP